MGSILREKGRTVAKISMLIYDLTGKTEEEQRLKEQFSFLQKMARAKCGDVREPSSRSCSAIRRRRARSKSWATRRSNTTIRST